MDILSTLLLPIAGGIAQAAGQNVYAWLKQALHDAFKDKSDQNIVQTLEAIGSLADADIRKRVAELTKREKLTAEQVEDLTKCLLNLAHGIRGQSTQGGIRSSFVRCDRLLDHLMQNILPTRRMGEAVADNSMVDWSLTRFLGMGSFGEVWEARTPHFPEARAVKFFTQPDAAQWVKAEQANLYHIRKTLDHPNLIKFLDVAINGKPFPFLVLEYANGGSLEEWILRKKEERPALDPRQLMEGIIRGLAQAHGQNIAHRDLKPANILLAGSEKDWLPKIADFGLGHIAAARPEGSAQASQSVVVGTSMYLPPEAMQPFSKRTPEQDDIFALGVIWYQLLVGRLERPPYDFAERLREHLVDSQTIRVLERCLAQPCRRFADASLLEDAFESIPPPPPPGWQPLPADCFDVQYLAREYLASKS